MFAYISTFFFRVHSQGWNYWVAMYAFVRLCCDADPSPQDPVLWLQYTNTHGLQKSCGEKGMACPLSKWERVRGLERAQESQPLSGQAFIVFLGPLYQRWSSFIMHRFVLWLSFADKGEDVAEYIKEGYLQCKRRNGQNQLCAIPGRSSPDFGKIKILSKHLLPQFRVREFQQGQVS